MSKAPAPRRPTATTSPPPPAENGSFRMTAAILPFPIARRRAFISKQAAQAALMHPEAGVQYLRHQLNVQAEAMRRKGVDEALIQRELRCMGQAIRAAFIKNHVAQSGSDP